ncbi:MAG: sulfite exporter TauE/SafE family protein [Dehalococcoidia bacterium]
MDPATAGVGFLGGLLIGLTGMAGGTVVTPLLIYVVDIKAVTAVGTNLVFAAVTKLLGAWQHGQQGTVDRQTALRLATGSLPGALIGVGLVELASRYGRGDPDEVMRQVLGYTLLIVAASLLVFTVVTLRRQTAARLRLGARQRTVATVAIGAVVGILVGFTSVGSGSLLVPFLLVAYPFGAATVVGTDVLHGALLSGVAATGHIAVGNVDWSLLPSLLVGSVPGIIIGSRLAPVVPERAMRSALSGVLLFMGTRLI